MNIKVKWRPAYLRGETAVQTLPRGVPAYWSAVVQEYPSVRWEYLLAVSGYPSAVSGYPSAHRYQWGAGCELDAALTSVAGSPYRLETT